MAWAEAQIDKNDIPAMFGDRHASEMIEWFSDELSCLRDALFWLRNAEKLDGSDRQNPDES